MMLKASAIAKRLKEDKDDNVDPFVITPIPDLEKLRQKGSASVDLRLGTWFLGPKRGEVRCLEIEDESSQCQLMREFYVPFGRTYFLHPRSFVLGITLEWIRLPKDLACYLIGRSSWGRRGLIIATATGVHPGFKGCLTLELTNVGEVPIEIIPGMRISQLCIHEVKARGCPETDKSAFIGQRKPTLGRVKLDEIADNLRRAYSTDGEQASH